MLKFVDGNAAIAVLVTGGFFTVYSMAKIWLGGFWGEELSPRGSYSATGVAPAMTASLMVSIVTVAIGLNPDLLYVHATEAASALMGGKYGMDP